MIKVFAVDDHAAFLATVALVVEATNGFELHGTARSAEEVLADVGAAGTSDADIVLIDYQLPGISGLELAQRLRTEARSNLPERRPLIILMSSYDLDALPSATVSWRSVDGFLAKAELSPAALLDHWRAHEAREVASGDGTI